MSEKILGIDESIVVATSSLIAFEDGIAFTEVPMRSILSHDRSKFVRVHGPGMIYIETSREQSHGLAQIFKG